MSSNKTIFSGYCCRLVRTDRDAQAEPQTSCQAYGTIVKLSGLPLDRKQLDQRLPGLSLVLKSIPPTEYALVTTHSLIPKSSNLSLWKFSEEFLGAKKTLDKYVSGMVSCCGQESGFIIPGPTTAREHGGKMCNLGLNFTVLFLNEKFKQHYCAQYGNQPNPPCVNISQCKAGTDLVCKYLHLPQAHKCELVQTADISTEPISSSYSSGSFEVIAGVSASGKVSMSAVELSVIKDSKGSPQNSSDIRKSSAIRSSMKLAQDIATFQKVKTVQCKGSSHLSVGMPLVYYTSTDGQESSKLIGVLNGEGQVLILSSLFCLFQGNPAACLSLLVFTEMWRLWMHKWSHLLLPHLENHPGQPKLTLEILIILLERKDKEEEHFLSVSRRDDPDTQLGFLKFLKVLFNHFDGQNKEAITQMTGEVCLQAGVPVDNFLSDIGGLCESLLSIAKYCCDYQDMENPKIVSLVEHCFICANEMLNFQHEQGVIEKVLCTEKFEMALENLQNKCPKSPQSKFPQCPVILSSLAAFYRKRHAPCRRILECTAQELCCCKEELASSKQEQEKVQVKLCELKKEYDEITKECHTLKTQYSAASDKCQKTVNVLKASEKRQRETDDKNMELNAEVKELRQQLISERELKQKLEADTEKLREDTRRLEEDKRKLEEEKRKLQEDKAKLERDNDGLKAQNDILKYQADQQRESSHELHRTMSDLTSKQYRQMQRQRNAVSDSCVIAPSITPLQEHSDHGITPTRVQSVRTTTDSLQSLSQTSPPSMNSEADPDA